MDNTVSLEIVKGEDSTEEEEEEEVCEGSCVCFCGCSSCCCLPACLFLASSSCCFRALSRCSLIGDIRDPSLFNGDDRCCDGDVIRLSAISLPVSVV